jgi:uncharacterized protein YndB with AHSA1/START domain
MVAVALAAGPSRGDVKPIHVGGFVVEKTFRFPAPPARVWEGLSGDVSEWWDHSFSGNPYRFYIDAKPGGGFWEIFDESGDGVQHAVVIGAQREKMLKLRGPLGFSGKALDMVHTFTLEPDGEGTRLDLVVHASGEMEEGWPAAVDQVWDHFLGERLRAWLAGELPAK